MKTRSLIVLAVLLLCSCSHQKNVTMSVSTLSDKIRGGWAGQTIGCTYGSPTEFKYTGMIADSVDIPWTGAELAYYFNEVPGMYDDIYMDLTFMDILDKSGMDAPASLFAEAFANADYQLWHANQAARYNILSGIAPPESGYWKNNPHADDIDFQIESDFAGLICPGMPERCTALCDTVGHIMNYGDGWYGGVFIAAMYSFAFLDGNIRGIVARANDMIPASSRFHRCISAVLDCYGSDPQDWKSAWECVNEHFSEDYGCPSCVLVPMSIDAVLNSAYVAIGLLYGNGDFGRSIDIATRCGQDSDCNPASVGGILGVISGYDALPEEWMAPLHEFEDIDFAHTEISLNDAYDMSLRQALQNIILGGGKVSGDEVTIITEKPSVVPYECSFEGVRPSERLSAECPIGKFGDFGFDGTGVVVKYWFTNTGGISDDYVAEVEVTIDGEPVQTSLMPLDFLKRRLEVFFTFDLSEGHHVMGLEWTNPCDGLDIHISNVITYDSI